MPNTPQEDQLVRDTMNQLSKVYSDYLIGNRFVLGVLGCPSNQLFNWVHFLDDAPFRSNLQLSGKIPDGCQVRGSTDRQGTRFQEDRTGTYEDELGNLKQMKTMTKQAFSMPMVRTGRRQQQQLQPNQSATSLKADICAAYFRGQFAPRLNDALALYG
jgi:hypothetical protein